MKIVKNIKKYYKKGEKIYNRAEKERIARLAIRKKKISLKEPTRKQQNKTWNKLKKTARQEGYAIGQSFGTVYSGKYPSKVLKRRRKYGFTPR